MKTKTLSIVAFALLIVLGIGAFSTGSLSSLQGKFSTGTTITSATMAAAAVSAASAKTYSSQAAEYKRIAVTYSVR